MTSQVVGRAGDPRVVAEFLTAAAERVCGLGIDGEAGIGKTTLWLHAVDQARARGFQVLSARAAQAESVLAYAALADLLRDIPTGVTDELPDVQRVAIDRVLLRGDVDGPRTDQRVVAAAFVSAIESLAAQGPVLVAVDDAPWLDSSSRAVLTYAARRLEGPIGIVVTARTQPDGPDPLAWLRLGRPDAMRRHRVGPLSLGGLHALISDRLGRTFPRPTLVRIADISCGNPFFALELARAFDGQPRADADLPASLAEVMRSRIGRLDRHAGRVLLAAACTAEPSVDLLAEATGNSPERVLELLEDVETNGIISIEGSRVRFSHPLLAHSVYTDASRPDRRRMHRVLAGIVTEPELKARHLALAAVSEDAATLQALDAAAEVARRRGAPAAAAELLEMAFRLGGDDPLRHLRAAEHHFEAGNADRATAHLDHTIELRPQGPILASALILRAGLRIYDNHFRLAAELLERALDAAGEVPKLRLRTLLLLAMALGMAGDRDASLRSADEAVRIAEGLGRPALLSQALALQVYAGLQFGQSFDEAALQRAVDLEDPDHNSPILFRAHAVNALSMAHIGRLDEAAVLITEVRRRCDERGAESDLMAVAGWSALIGIWRGRFEEAAGYAKEAVQRAEQLGGESMLVIPHTVRAAAYAYLGRVDEARADARSAYDCALHCESVRMTEWPLTTLGFIEVSLGNHAEALKVMEPLIAASDRTPGMEILSSMHVAEIVEAMSALGRLDEAEPFVAEMERNGRTHDRPWMLAIGARCRSMLLVARGDVEVAERTARQALTEHDRLPMPFERARTELLLGQLQRRLRYKDLAAATLRSALQTFEALGTPLWADRARAELARTNVVPGGRAALTPSEQRVAELAASGMTNRDVAAALFISPKTVEHNLGRVYRKLGIRSRAELGRLMGARD